MGYLRGILSRNMALPRIVKILAGLAVALLVVANYGVGNAGQATLHLSAKPEVFRRND